MYKDAWEEAVQDLDQEKVRHAWTFVGLKSKPRLLPERELE
jgi:hypothetical protein